MSSPGTPYTAPRQPRINVNVKDVETTQDGSLSPTLLLPRSNPTRHTMRSVQYYRNVQLFMLFLLLNDLLLVFTFSLLRSTNTFLEFVVFLWEFSCIIVNGLVLWLALMNTYFFKAGKLKMLMWLFRMPFTAVLLHGGVLATFRLRTIMNNFANCTQQSCNIWTLEYSILHVIHILSIGIVCEYSTFLAAVFYYWSWMHAMRLLCHERFYMDSSWFRRLTL